jgi:hypothetical protein
VTLENKAETYREEAADDGAPRRDDGRGGARRAAVDEQERRAVPSDLTGGVQAAATESVAVTGGALAEQDGGNIRLRGGRVRVGVRE